VGKRKLEVAQIFTFLFTFLRTSVVVVVVRGYPSQVMLRP
jgi:hypothetical protein